MSIKTGYWTERRLAIWRNLTPSERDYDRYQGQYPPGQGACETAEGRLAIEQRDNYDGDRGCSCHINPPCSTCVEAGDEE